MRSMMGEERGIRSIAELAWKRNDRLPLISPIAKARWVVPFFSPFARGEDKIALAGQPSSLNLPRP